jgi:AraC family transcriptional regulator
MPMQTWYADANLRVGEWWCPGATEEVRPEEELPAHELLLARVGGHIRRFGRHRVVIDAAHVIRTSARMPFRSMHAISLPQRATFILISDALRDEMPRVPDRIPVTSRVALSHLRLLRSARLDGPHRALAVHESALDIMTAVVGASTALPRESRAVPRSARAAVEATAQTLAFRFAHDLSLDALASEVGLSPWYLSRVFRRLTGVSIWQQVTALRLHAALEHLAAGEVSLSDLAQTLGFSSHSHFSATFRRVFGVSPSMTRF